MTLYRVQQNILSILRRRNKFEKYIFDLIFETTRKHRFIFNLCQKLCLQDGGRLHQQFLEDVV